MKPIRLILADDHVMVREALARFLDDQPGLKTVCQVAEPADVLPAIRRHEPDVAVLDYSMPGLDTPLLIEQIRKRHPRTKVIVLTLHENVHYATKSLQAGAHSFVVKTSSTADLVRAIRDVEGGKAFVSPSILEKLTLHMVGPANRAAGLDSLSRREFELLRMLAAGLKMQDCAKRMHVSGSTASTYRGRLMQKLKLTSTGQLIRFALENGITG